jgi:hypothetical protein
MRCFRPVVAEKVPCIRPATPGWVAGYDQDRPGTKRRSRGYDQAKRTQGDLYM